MIDKAPDAYRTISEVAEELDLPQHVLRFWETRFSQIKPLKRGGGRRYYRPEDVELLKGVRYLLYSEGYTIKGVQKILKEQGPKAVQTLVKTLAPDAFEPNQVSHSALSNGQTMPTAPLPGYSANPATGMQPPQNGQKTVSPSMMRLAASLPDVDPLRQQPLFDKPVLVEPDLFETIPAVPVRFETPWEETAPVANIPAPLLPQSPPNVSFMRGGLSKPVVNEAHKLLRPANLRPAAAPDPTIPPRFAPVFEDHSEIELPAAPSSLEPRTPVTGLTPEARRILQSALFEMTECRRLIEKTIAGRAR